MGHAPDLSGSTGWLVVAVSMKPINRAHVQSLPGRPIQSSDTRSGEEARSNGAVRPPAGLPATLIQERLPKPGNLRSWVIEESERIERDVDPSGLLSIAARPSNRMGNVIIPQVSRSGSLTLLRSRKSGDFDISCLLLRALNLALSYARCQESPTMRSQIARDLSI